MSKIKKEKQRLEEEKSKVPNTLSGIPSLTNDEISELLLSQIHFLDDKIKSYYLVNFVLLMVITIFSLGLIFIGVILAFQYGSADSKVIFSITSILFGFVFLISVTRLNPIERIILMIKRISQIKVILVGYMKQITYMEQAVTLKDSEEVSQLLSFLKEIVQQTVDDLENPFD